MGFGSGVGRLAVAAVLLPLIALSACETVPFGIPGPEPSPTPPPDVVLPPANGEIIGTGPVRVALLLPMTASGNGARIAAEFRNAARLAVEDFGPQTIELVVKDTAGKPEQALAMASEASAEGSSAVLGPLFAPEVTQAATVLRPAGKIEIAFSSDRSVAGAGTYLNSFLPEGIVDRSVSFAIARSYRSFVALVPNGPAGDIAERELRRTLAAKGGTLIQTARYDYDNSSLQVAAASIAPAAGQAQAIFIPDGGNSPNAIAAALKSNGVDLTSKKLVGTGQWTTSNLTDPALAGGWFADADQAKLATYKARYRAKFGADPSVNSALAYDTVALAAGIVRRYGAVGFRKEVVETPAGYSGYTGTFRFLAGGASERGYAVYEVGAAGVPTVVSPAPTSFGARTGG
jgi:ABC-type branched-subunit amino acid transport system substrate-binding protein